RRPEPDGGDGAVLGAAATVRADLDGRVRTAAAAALFGGTRVRVLPPGEGRVRHRQHPHAGAAGDRALLGRQSRGIRHAARALAAHREPARGRAAARRGAHRRDARADLPGDGGRIHLVLACEVQLEPRPAGHLHPPRDRPALAHADLDATLPGVHRGARGAIGRRGPGFTELPAAGTGIRFVNTVTHDSALLNRHLAQGGGVALGDVDGDGLPDIYLTSDEGSNALYKNLGDWRFEDITARAGVAM